MCTEIARPEVSIVVLSFNRAAELRAHLPVLAAAATSERWELIVIDNGSSDGSSQYLAELAQRVGNVRVVLNQSNLGVAGGRNIGWAIARGEFILNLDDDAMLRPCDIKTLVRFVVDNPSVGIASPRIVHAITGAPQCDYGPRTYSMANFHGACHLVRRQLMDAIGLLDDMCSFGGEELDYSIRTRGAGFDVVFAPMVTATHNNFARVGQLGEWRTAQWVFNFTRVLYKHFPVRMALVCSLRYLATFVFLLGKQRRMHGVATICLAYARGALSGNRARDVAVNDVCAFYRNPALRPEFGNVPVIAKAVRYVCSVGDRRCRCVRSHDAERR